MWRRLRLLLSWQIAGPIIAYALSALLVVSVVEAFVARQQAVDSLQQARTNAIHRIDQLQHEISYLQTRLRNTSVRDARERGRLEDAIQALAEQIRQAGGEPVTTGQPQRSQQPAPTPAPARTVSPRPSPSPSPSQSPTPSPSSSCTLRDVLHDPTHCLHL